MPRSLNPLVVEGTALYREGKGDLSDEVTFE